MEAWIATAQESNSKCQRISRGHSGESDAFKRRSERVLVKCLWGCRS